jgi:hypothetical protein
MYPRNAASPEPIGIGPVVQISDGAVQTAGVTVRIKPVGVAEADGGGTTAYSTDGIVLYTPTQAETNYTSFILIAKKTGCIPATVTVVTSESTVSGRVYAATVGDKTGYSLTQGFPANFAALGINSSGHVLRVVLVDTTSVNSDMRGTDNALLASSYTAAPTAAAVADAVWDELMIGHTTNGSYGSHVVRSANQNQNTAQINGNGHLACVLHETQPDVINSDALADSATAEIAAAVRVNLATELARIDIGISSRLAGASYVAPDNSSITAIKTVTDKLNTGLIQDGAFYQFTVNMLENAPAGGGGGGGGDATLANQNLILNQLDDIQSKTDLISGAGGITSLLAGAVLLPGQITSFPDTLVIGDSYTQTNGRAIQIPVVDTDGFPISSSGSLNFANATVTFVIKRAGETDTSRIISGTATFVDPPGTGEGFEPYALIQISSSETAKGLMKYKYTGILTFTWSSNPAEVVSFETNTITFKE